MVVLLIIVIFAFLILVHEFGHFFIAKKSGIKVEEFGLGFPPSIAKFKKGETIYSINWIPLGGFVKILGEQGEGESDPRSFINQPWGKRFFTLIAGVLMNLLVAFFILVLVLNLGAPSALTPQNQTRAVNPKVAILEVSNNSPAQRAGIRMGDVVLSLISANKTIKIINAQTLINTTNQLKGQEVTLELQRDGQILDFKLTPRISPPPGQGPMGIALADVAIIKYGFFESIWQASKSIYELTGQIFIALGGLFYHIFKTGSLPPNILGPVGIGVVLNDAYHLGLNYLLNLVALISLNLAVLNVLPIPALDGGRVLFLIIERITHKKVNVKTEALIHQIGFILLLILAFFVTFHDIRTYF